MSKYILLFFSYISPLVLLFFFLVVQFLITHNKAGRASALYNFILIFFWVSVVWILFIMPVTWYSFELLNICYLCSEFCYFYFYTTA
jgi:hypothetical protein